MLLMRRACVIRRLVTEYVSYMTPRGGDPSGARRRRVLGRACGEACRPRRRPVVRRSDARGTDAGEMGLDQLPAPPSSRPRPMSAGTWLAASRDATVRAFSGRREARRNTSTSASGERSTSAEPRPCASIRRWTGRDSESAERRTRVPRARSIATGACARGHPAAPRPAHRSRPAWRFSVAPLAAYPWPGRSTAISRRPASAANSGRIRCRGACLYVSAVSGAWTAACIVCLITCAMWACSAVESSDRVRNRLGCILLRRQSEAAEPILPRRPKALVSEPEQVSEIGPGIGIGKRRSRRLAWHPSTNTAARTMVQTRSASFVHTSRHAPT